MKNFSLWLILALLLIASPANASPTIRIAGDVYQPCSGISRIACYDKPTNTIWMRASIKPENIEYVFLHEYGHYLTLGSPAQELQQLFPAYGNLTVWERAADGFYLFVKYPEFRTEQTTKFWINNLKK